jgi:hypothetical protein
MGIARLPHASVALAIGKFDESGFGASFQAVLGLTGLPFFEPTVWDSEVLLTRPVGSPLAKRLGTYC